MFAELYSFFGQKSPYSGLKGGNAFRNSLLEWHFAVGSLDSETASDKIRKKEQEDQVQRSFPQDPHCLDLSGSQRKIIIGRPCFA